MGRNEMLKRFSVSNFKNFEGKVTLALDNPAGYGFNTQVVREGIITKGLVCGANGSGTSNLGLALLDITIHLTDRKGSQPSYDPYLNLDSKKPEAEFEYVFEFEGSEVIYRYAKTSASDLVYEKLVVGDREVLGYDFARRSGYVELEGAEALQITSPLPGATDPRSRVKFVCNHATLQDDAENRACAAFMRYVDRMVMFSSLPEGGYQGLPVGEESPTQGIIRAEGVEGFRRFLRDQGIDYDLRAVDVNGQKELYCRYRNASVPFASVASAGTRALALFYHWFERLSDASLVFIDDFDAFYHFELAERIVLMLRDLEGTQVFLTTHNTDLLSNDLLRPDAYFYLRDGLLDSLNHLTDKELRRAHNLQKLFKAGSFDR